MTEEVEQSTTTSDDEHAELIKKVVNEHSEDNSSSSSSDEVMPADHDESDDEQISVTTTEDNVAASAAADEEDSNLEDNDNTTPSVDSSSVKQDEPAAAPVQEADADEVDKETESDPLLGAVTDLLSSILGLQFEQKLLIPHDDVVEEQQRTTTTEKVLIDETKVAEVEPAAALTTTTIKSTNEIDRMIENLASSVGFATEASPTFVADSETLLVSDSEQSTTEAPAAATSADDEEDIDEIRKENLAELEKIAVEVEEMKQLASLRQRINQVMDLVKLAEADSKLNGNQPTTSNDPMMTTKLIDEDDVVSGTLKELHSNLGIDDYETMPASNRDKIKNIESTINESLANNRQQQQQQQDEQVFLPNAAKAALRYKYYDNHDF